ncbi:MAG: hypothetical protein ACRECQ_11950 [Burkholderiaceae bacterium]
MQVVEAETALEQSRSEIARLETEAARLRLAVEGLQEALDECHRDIDAISTDLIQRSSELADVSLAHKKVTALYAAMVRSTSWRITAPLRWVGKLFRMIFPTTGQSEAGSHPTSTIDAEAPIILRAPDDAVAAWTDLIAHKSEHR